MNWENLVSALIGLITGGGVSWLFRIKGDKAGSEADAIDKAADAMKKLLDNAEQQQTTFNRVIEGKDKLIEQQQNLIEGYKVALEEANKKLKELEYRIADNGRKISGMQKIIDTAINDRRIAESLACFNDKCEQRKPNSDENK